MEILTATYHSRYGEYDVEILEETLRNNIGRPCQMAYIHILNDAHILGTPGMWGGCEQSRGWVPVDTLTNRRVDTVDIDLADPSDDAPLPVEMLEARAEYAQINDLQMTGRGA
jgi:hypothetical protein